MHFTCISPHAAKAPEMKWYIFAVDGQGFFAMDLPAGAVAAASINSAVILVQNLRASSISIEAGLKELIDQS